AHFGNTTPGANRYAQYVVVSPTGTHPDGFNTPTSAFCAWHDYTSSSYGDIAYTNMPYVTDLGTSCGENFVNPGSAGLLDGFSIVNGHEYAETVTDQNPPGRWTSLLGQENGDERVIEQHEPLGLLEQRAPPCAVGFGRGAREQRVIGRARVVRQVHAEVALQVLREGVGVVVVAHPAGAEHLDIAAIDVLQQRFELHLRQAHVGAEGLPPHGGDRDRELGVHFAGVVAQLEGERPLA